MSLRSTLHLLLAVALGAGLSGCGGDDVRIEFEPEAAAGSPIELELRLAKGLTYDVRADIAMVMDMDVDGDDARMDFDTRMELAYEVKDLNQAGSANVSITYKAFKMEMGVEAPGRSVQVSYDSRTGRAEPAGMKILDKMIGKSIEMSVKPDGSIEGVSGLEEMLDEVGAQGAQQAKSLSQAFEQMTMFFPDKPVDNGDKWTVVQETELPAPMKVSMECMLLAHDEKTATVGVNATIRMTGMPGGSAVTSADVSGTMGGKAVVDLETGFTTSLDLKMKLEGTMRSNGQDVGIDAVADMKYSSKR